MGCERGTIVHISVCAQLSGGAPAEPNVQKHKKRSSFLLYDRTEGTTQPCHTRAPDCRCCAFAVLTLCLCKQTRTAI